MSGSSVACGVFVVLTPTKCNHCALRAFLQVDGKEGKTNKRFEEQDQAGQCRTLHTSKNETSSTLSKKSASHARKMVSAYTCNAVFD